MNATTYQSHYQPQWVKADFIDFILEKVNPLWSINKVKAEVVEYKQLSEDMYQVHLQPNSKFNKIWQAGQSVLVTIQIAGVFHQRSYSIVEITDQGQVVLGIKRQGQVSKFLTQPHQNLIVELSQVQGDFVLHQGTAPALFIASGSGITAIYAMLKQALKQNLQQVYVLYFNRHPIYHAEIEKLAAQYPQLQYLLIDTTTQKQHFDENLINAFCPDWQQYNAYVCGASPLMQAAKQLYADHQKQNLLHTEYFQPTVDENATEQPITFRRSQRDFIATQTLLISAEQAGLKPSHGCRMGICNTCTCTKVSGVTKNILTGEIESEDNRPIKLCISQAISPVVIDL
ncbi:ferredoxin reductase [Acinetobacter puyangensis]|uniref:Ferredoxin-NADP reductase n=1 Tax=Acinetobacter puyangensis TaxID=1096779 RepID=A0A240ECP9_9GAMM|nr:iron-sulfur cluster-binding domain-containing protein [Acinetobacter puyangensis]SNX46033.1 Ferredoxin-NADP reductase [Acinetobacter puyangensis]